MAISINPIFPVIAAQDAASEAVLQPGRVVDAKVQGILADNLVRIAIANLTIEAFSEIPVQVGQSLRLAVSQTEQGIRLAVVGTGLSGTPVAGPADTLTLTPDVAAAVTTKAALTPALTTLEALSVSAAAQAAATRQGSLSPLYANLLIAAGSGSLSPDVRQVLHRLLALRPGLDPGLTGSDIKSAFRSSGLFLEASLAAGLETGQPAASANTQLPDMKAALLVLREALSISVGDASRAPPPAAGAGSQQAQQTASPMATGAPPLSPDIDAQDVYLPQAQPAVTDDPDSPANQTVFPRASDAGLRAAVTGAALNALQEVLQNRGNSGFGAESGQGGDPDAAPPLRTVSASGPAAGGNVFVVRTSTPPPPFGGALPAAQPVALPGLSPAASPEEIARRLLDDTDAAISRQVLLQIASLPDRADTAGARLDQITPRWNFEIPFAVPTGTAIAQFEISRDAAGLTTEAAARVWRARFSVDVEPAGPVHALVSLAGDTTAVRLWAERPSTASRLRAGASQLTQALSRAELQPGDIIIGEGAPPQPNPAPAGHFLDRAL
ncbi:flagellar hook-length control protein FliK [Nitrobacter winogradskyi]|uniref:Uncharacterized protein n=2 Tax=Nitrobacter winogradskyi TaxID=913 RepID=A0ACC6AGN1_NITWI|nr:flagellar hook-length control protein FliK [Nitrobacter winogradskyi]MCP1998549.1 hypothetical protein [Nitrobacter winogradskyi]GEC15489.1 flagellar hook-length control protein FliK [Nitrobacter winogradskyi]